MVVGDYGTGSLFITSSGTVNVGGGSLIIGNGGLINGSESTGTVTVDGAGSKLSDGASLSVGAAGRGTFNAIGGGSVTATTISIGNSLLAVDVGRGSSIIVGGGSGTITNGGTVRVLAGPNVPAGNMYSPISAGTWRGSGAYQPVGGTWNSSTHQFTASTVASSSGAGGATASIDTSMQQRTLIADTTAGTSLGVSFLAATSTTPISLTAATLGGAALSTLQSDLPAGQAVLDGWGLSSTGYSAGNPAYLSLLIGAGYTPCQLATAAFSRDKLSVWDYNGTAWSPFQANDLTFDGTYASFTVTALNGYDYAVVGTPLLMGDANRDGQVDINDLTIVLTNFGRTTGMTWSTGDFVGERHGGRQRPDHRLEQLRPEHRRGGH